jgi:CubicO group peptidase (beta-lactamase class C family)
MTQLSELPAATAQVLDGALEEFARAHHVPGLMFGLVSGGRLIWSKAIGLADREHRRPVTAETRFRIASMTKNTTGLAILMLRDAGKLRLDDPAAAYVPELARLKLPSADSAPVTLRDLLTHSAGLVTDDPWGDRMLGIAPEDFTRLLQDGAFYARPPRIAFEYSNLGYAILGRVITNVTGQRYQDYITDSILRPLGMHATGFDFYAAPEAARAVGYHWAHDTWAPEIAERDGEFGAMGGLLTSAEDYARYIAFLLSAWPPRNDAETGPAKRATVRELGAAHSFPLPASTREVGGKTIAIASVYGYGMVSSQDPALGRTLHHRGGLPGYGSHFVISPDTGIGLFTFCNVTYAEANKPNLAAMAALHEAGLWQPRVPRLSPALRMAIDFAMQAYAAGRIDESSALLAVNLLPDEPASDRNAALAKLKAKLGDAGPARIQPQHDLAGRFTATCANGTLTGSIVLSPGPRPGIQTLEFEEAGAAAG